MILFFPVIYIQNYVNTVLSGSLAQFLRFIFESTFGFASVFLLITVTYKYSSNITQESGIINILSCIVAIASYVSLLGLKPEITVNSVNHQAVLISVLDVKSIFSALLCSVLSTKMFLFFVKKMFIIHNFTDFSSDIDFRTALRTMIPMLFTISIFALASIVISQVFDVASFNDLLIKFFVSPFEKLGRSLWSGLLIFLWNHFSGFRSTWKQYF